MKYLCAIIVALSSCSHLLHVSTTSDAKKIWSAHKRIAIIPIKVSSPDNYKLDKRELAAELNNMQKLSFSVLNNIYTVLQSQQEKLNLSVQVMPVDSVLLILSKQGYKYANLPNKNFNNYCSLLNVDAVVAGEIIFNSPNDFMTAMLLPSPLNSLYSIPRIEKAVVSLSVYDSKSARPIWNFKERNSIKGYNEYYKPSRIINVSNEEYLIAYMFDKAMKALPYVIQSPIKRYY